MNHSKRHGRSDTLQPIVREFTLRTRRSSTMRNLVFIFLALITFAAVADAQVPAATQAAPLKVGVVNTGLFSNPTGGITKLVAALRTLEAEFKTRSDEIATLRTRFEALQ